MRKRSCWTSAASESGSISSATTSSTSCRFNATSSSARSRQRQTRIGIDVSWIEEDKWTLSKRVEQLETGLHWAEEPASRVSHLVTNVQIKEVRPSLDAPEDVVAASRFLIYQNRVERETALFVGKRLDLLRRVDGTWKIARREVTLDQSVLLAKNLTVFF